MSEAITNYVKVLYSLSVPEEAVKTTQELFAAVPALGAALQNPLLSLKKKRSVIEKIFPEEMQNFLKVTCKYGRISEIREILEEYQAYSRKQQGILEAVLYYVTPPTKEQEEGFREFLKKEYHKEAVSLSLVQDPSLLGGFILRAGEYEYDNSLRGRYKQLEQRLIRR